MAGLSVSASLGCARGSERAIHRSAWIAKSVQPASALAITPKEV